MKKSMFITSVIMVVVLAIALTTSSLAWYTGAAGSTTVTAGKLSISSLGVEAGEGLVIGTTPTGMSNKADLTATNVADLTPAALYDFTDSYVAKDQLDESIVGGKFGSVLEISGTNVKGTAPKISTSNSIYLASTGLGITPEISVEFSDKTFTGTEPALWVAVLAKDPNGTPEDPDDDFWKVVHLAVSRDDVTKVTAFDLDHAPLDSENLVLTDILELVSVTGMTWTGVECPAAEDAAWGTPIEYKAIAWFDGNYLFNSNSGCSISYTISFSVPVDLGA
ncbi:MAG: hypothetical protein IJX70_01360 [Clostridia bacterium]|nr:hypothetical protein [Clostridia bacterium]